MRYRRRRRGRRLLGREEYAMPIDDRAEVDERAQDVGTTSRPPSAAPLPALTGLRRAHRVRLEEQAPARGEVAAGVVEEVRPLARPPPAVVVAIEHRAERRDRVEPVRKRRHPPERLDAPVHPLDAQDLQELVVERHVPHVEPQRRVAARPADEEEEPRPAPQIEHPPRALGIAAPEQAQVLRAAKIDVERLLDVQELPRSLVGDRRRIGEVAPAQVLELADLGPLKERVARRRALERLPRAPVCGCPRQPANPPPSSHPVTSGAVCGEGRSGVNGPAPSRRCCIGSCRPRMKTRVGTKKAWSAVRFRGSNLGSKSGPYSRPLYTLAGPLRAARPSVFRTCRQQRGSCPTSRSLPSPPGPCSRTA